MDPRKRTSVFVGLVISQFVVCLSGTILSTSITPILEELGGASMFSWMFTSYLLTQTIFIPIAGKLSDIYGRRSIFITGLAIFLVGIFLCGICNSVGLMVVLRAIQGVGAGMMIPVINATVADVYSPRERGKIQGVLGSMFSVGMAVGPVLGGLLTDFLGWRSVFLFNVPLLLLAMALCIRTIPSVRKEGRPSIDYPGMVAIALFLLDVLVILSFCGSTFEWASVETVLLVAAAMALIIAFVMIERRSKNPVLDPSMFHDKVITWACIGLLISNMCTMGATAYIARYLQTVLLYDATTAGLYLLPFVAGMLITSLSSGFLLNRTGYRIWLIMGPVVSCIGLALMSTITVDTEIWLMMVYMFIIGFGGGCLSSILMVAVQNNADPENMGMAMSGMNIFRSMGTTVATAFIGLIINVTMGAGMGSILPDDLLGSYPSDSGILDHLTDAALSPYATDIRILYGDGIADSFLVCGILILLVLVLVAYVRDRRQAESRA